MFSSEEIQELSANDDICYSNSNLLPSKIIKRTKNPPLFQAYFIFNERVLENEQRHVFHLKDQT